MSSQPTAAATKPNREEVKPASQRGTGREPGTLRQLLSNPLVWLFLLALFTRFIKLAYHSLWFDEAMSTFWASQTAGEIWRVGIELTADKHPPLYYLLLRAWMGLFGDGDFALRSLGAIIGALAVLPVYGIGYRLGGKATAVLSGLLLALNPFLVWYSQEVRMFMPATTFALAGLFGILYLADPPADSLDAAARRLKAATGVLLVVLGFLAALYTYLYSAFLLPVAGAWTLLLWWWRRGQAGAASRFWLSVAALALVGLLYLPLAWSAWQVSGAEAVPGQPFQGMLPSLFSLLQVYTVGWPPWERVWLAVVAAAAAVLALLGCFARFPDRGWRDRGLLLALWLGIVILIGGYLLGRDSGVFAESRYQIALAPALCLAWGRALGWFVVRSARSSPLSSYRGGKSTGSTGLAGGGPGEAREERSPARPGRRWLLSLALAAGLVTVTLAGLSYNWVPENRREAWREAAAFVEAHAGSDDAVLIHADYVHVAFERYFDGQQPVFFPFTDRLDDPVAVDPPLSGLSVFDNVWVVQSHHQELDPQNLILGWFAARYPLITEAYPAGIAIHAFAQRYRTAALPASATPLDPQPELGPMRLLSCIHKPGPIAAQDDLFHPPSGWVHVTTYWQPAPAPGDLDEGSADIKPIVRLIDEQGQIWGESLQRANDAFHVWPVSRWVSDQVVRADHDVNLNPVTPPGAYQIVVEIPGAAEKVLCGLVQVM